MKLIKKIQFGIEFLGIKARNNFKPIITAWEITNRCNLNCSYCFVTQNSSRELDTDECKEIIDLLKIRGTRILSFTGGEPTLRKDLACLLEYAKEKGLITLLNTNGLIFDETLLDHLDSISLSLDGPEEINDKIRGKGTYQATMKIIGLCKERKIPVTALCVISGRNYRYVRKLLKIAKYLKIKIAFQPIVKKSNSSEYIRHVNQAVRVLLKEKKKGSKEIINTIQGLEFLKKFPYGKPQTCISGTFYLRLSPEGYVNYCGLKKLEKKISFRDKTNKEIQEVLRRKPCSDCWCCNLIEMSNIYNLKISSILARSFMLK